MFLSWWRGLVKLADPKAHKFKGAKRIPVPRKFRAAVRVEQLEDRVVPFGGQANVFLNLQNVAAQLNTIAAPRSATVPVFIDFDSVNPGTTGGVGAGTFYVLYDPKVLSISETATSVGSDIKLGSLLAGMSSNYALTPATGFSTGVVAIGLDHSGSAFLTGSPTGHLIELDFHVVQSTAVGNSTLLDLQSYYSDVNGNFHPAIVHDQGGAAYTLTPSPNAYATIGTASSLTQPGALSPNTTVNPFSPNDADAADAAIQIVAKPPNLAPTVLADTYSMAPNTANFSPTMTIAGLASGVLANDTATANGPMNAVLTGSGVTTTVLAPQTAAISSVAETGLTVTVTTSANTTYQVGEEVTLAGVALPPSGTYNGSFIVSSVLNATQFTYQSATAGMGNANGGTVANAAQTLYSAATPHGNVTLNANDGSLAYTPTSGYTGTDTFTYQAVDAVSNTPSANATVTVYVGGYLSIPHNLVAGAIGSQVAVPVNILNANPANSGGLDDATIGINYDATVFSVVSVASGTVPTIAGWTGLTANTGNAGQVIINIGDTGGALPVSSTAGGSLAIITFKVIGLPATGLTSVINISGTHPKTPELDVADSANPALLPLAVTPIDNTNFNGVPGQTDGLVTINPIINTTTTVSATVGVAAVSTVMYGTPVTLAATISPVAGSIPPAAGSVDFRDNGAELGTITTETSSGNKAVFTLVTTPNQLQVILANGGVHAITASYDPTANFLASAATLAGGLAVTPASLTITAKTFTKTYDSTTTAGVTPTVSGLIGSDTVTGLAEVFASAKAGTSKTLSVSAYTVNDGNGGLDYAVTTVTNTTGLINKAALTITARPNTKVFDGTTSSLATPTVSGLQGTDTVTGLAEVYSDSTVGTGKTLSVSAYTVNDGNSGNNYTVATVSNTTGVINPAPGKALVSLDVGPGLTAVTSARGGVVKVFIDFDNNVAAGTSVGSNGGLAGGSFYVLYDPAVLSIGETATAVSSDIKLGSLLSSSSSFYTLASVSGFSTGVVAIGLNHSGSTFVSGAQTGHLLELDFHVVSTTSIGISSLLDLQSSFTDSTGAVRTTNIHDKGGLLYALTPAPAQYATLGTASTLTQTGALTPSQFSPADTDTTDAAIDVVAGTPALAPTTLPDSYSMAPNTANFTTTMTATGLSGGVLANDTATSNGPMDAVLTGAGVSGTALSPQSSGIVSASETGNVVTITTAANVNLSAGEGVTIAGVANASYNGYFPVATVLSSTQFTYTAAATSLADASGGTVSAVATTVYSAATAHGQVWLNSLDGSFAYTPTANYLGTDTFTYKAVDAASNTPSTNTTVTINVGGYLSIPQNIVPSGNTVTVPVNIASGNPANSGGLTNATIGINYDASKLSVTDAGIAEGTLNSAAGWTNFTVNTNTPGEIIITTSNTGGAAPLSSTTGGSLAIITFTDVGFPTGTSVVNISAINPAVTTLDVAGTAGTGNSVPLPFAIAPVDNTNFNGTPGATDGLITFPPQVPTTSTVTASVGGSSVATVQYGTPVTLAATVVPGNGSNGPVVGSVDFKDGSADLGTTSSETFVGNTGIFTLVTTANQLQVIAANGGVHTITSTYIPGGYFAPTTATVAGGLAVTPVSLTITATTNTKTYDATTTSLATPTVAGLIGSDTVTGLAEAYTNANVGSGKTLSVSAYTINDGNGGNGGKDYTVTTVNNTTGVITKAALTITALTNTKTYDSTTSAAATPTVAGLQGGDTITGLAEFYTNANAGASKTLSVSNFTVNDGNGGNNYTITTVNSITGLINKAALTITALTNTKNYDGTTTAAATPTVAGLVGGDSVTGLAEVYSDPSIGTSKTLSVSAYTVNDGNSGNNYAVTTITNNTGAITVGPFSKYIVSIVGSSTIVAGQAFLFTVQATDAFGNPVTTYNGPSNVTNTTGPVDPLGNFPVSGQILSNGFGFFQGSLKTAGTYTLSTTGTNGTGTFTGTSASFNVIASYTDHFTVAAPPTAATGVPFNITVTARDVYGNPATSYNGTVQLTSTDGAAQFGGGYTFTTSGANPDHGVHTFSVTLATPGNQTITATDTLATNPTITGTSGTIVTRGLVVSSFALTPTGFTANFNRAIVPADLTLYGGNLTTVQDVVLRGAHVGPIHGTLLIDPFSQSITFNATSSYLVLLNSVYEGTNSAVLPDDTYTATLFSGVGLNGFIDTAGDHLDGANTAGHANFVTVFATSYQHNATPVLGIPDFARGPDSNTPIKVPNDTAAGIPVTLYNAHGVTDVTFALAYDPTLLTLAAPLSGSGSDATDAAATLTMVSNFGGVAAFHYHDANALSGNVVLGDIAAVVPNTAVNLYQVKELLQIGSIVINHGAVSGAVGADSVHVNAYFGDVNADGMINGLDTLFTNTVAVGAATGFDAFHLTDPVIVGDIAGDFAVDAGDVSALNLYVAHLNPAQIPVPPGLAVTSPNAADPTLSLSASSLVTSTPGAVKPPVISVVLDHPHPEGSTGLTEATLALTYDPAVLSVSPADITLGSIPSQGQRWQLLPEVDAATGQIGIELFSQTPITATQAGSLVNIAFHLTSNIPRDEHGISSSTASAVQLVSSMTLDGQPFATVLADAQGALILGAGLDHLVIPTGADTAPAVPPDNTKNAIITVSSGLVNTDIAAAANDVETSDYVSTRHATEVIDNAPANETSAPRTIATSLPVAAMPALQSAPVPLANAGISSQVIQIVNVSLVSALPTVGNLLTATDRFFLALARRTDTGSDLDGHHQIADTAGRLDWLRIPDDASQPEDSPTDNGVNPSTDGLSVPVDVLDKVFADLDDLSDFGDFEGPNT